MRLETGQVLPGVGRLCKSLDYLANKNARIKPELVILAADLQTTSVRVVMC